MYYFLSFRTLLNLIHKVTVDELNRVGKKYLSALFDSKRIKTAIVSVPAKAEQIVEAFKRYFLLVTFTFKKSIFYYICFSVNIDLTVYSSLEESFLK
jgi:hypothetical protein